MWRVSIPFEKRALSIWVAWMSPWKRRSGFWSAGFELTKTADGWDCIVPPWRHDVLGEADLVEEVLRIHGFDKIPRYP